MRLTIDTKHDSHEDIKHAIQILSNILERQGQSISGTREASPTETTNMMSMFDDHSSETNNEQPTSPLSMFSNTEPAKSDTGPDFTSFLNLSNNQTEEKPTEEHKVEYF
jgi:hypothetical protein